MLEEVIMAARASPWVINIKPYTLKSRLSLQVKRYAHQRIPSTPYMATSPSTTKNIKTTSTTIT